MIINSPAIVVPVSLAACHTAWLKARRGKRPSVNQLAFELRWLDRLLELKAALRAGSWLPRRTVSFIVRHPKTREIHAPDFADRVVHHLLVERLEPLFEPVFIHDSYANRKGKGSHAAVDRLQGFMRSRNGQGWYLQLDIHNFFNSIHRPTLYARLCRRLQQSEQRAVLLPIHALALRSLCHKLLATPLKTLVRDPLAATRVPPHKRLVNARTGCGLPVGNLTSQFFANVYLDALDQFIKHTLHCRHYVRYVDDFVLLHDSPQQLQQWHRQISDFLQQSLRLRLNDAVQLQPLCQGIDFLGYRVFTRYRRVRPRVLAHCRAKLAAWSRRHVRHNLAGLVIKASPQTLAKLQAMLGSYWGHFSHANSVRLRHALFTHFGWLEFLFSLSADGQLLARWVLPGTTLAQQTAALISDWPTAYCLIECGCRIQVFGPGKIRLLLRPEQQSGYLAQLRHQRQGYVLARQSGWLRHGTRRRELTEWYIPEPKPI